AARPCAARRNASTASPDHGASISASFATHRAGPLHQHTKLRACYKRILPVQARMRQVLKLHPDTLSSAATQIEVEAARPRAGSLVLSYFVTGEIRELRMPPVTTSARTDGLWQHTCFEAFVGTSLDASYYEFNFAPSTQWAAYRFSSYRRRMRV